MLNWQIFEKNQQILGFNVKILIKYTYRQLDGNAIMSLDGVSLDYLRSLRTLRLEGNMLQRVPTEALVGLHSLEAL